jgi:hypothetical protein
MPEQQLPIDDIAQSLSSIAESLDSAMYSRHTGSKGLGQQHPVHNEEPNIVGGLFAIATALNRVADAIESHGQ